MWTYAARSTTRSTRCHLEDHRWEIRGRSSTTITAPTVPGYRKYGAYPAPPTGDVAKAKQLLAGKTVPPLRYCYRPGSQVQGEQVPVAVKEALTGAGFQIVMSPTDPIAHKAIVSKKGVECHLIASGSGQDYPSNATVMGVLMKGGSAI